jgi:hypothetical protein
MYTIGPVVVDESSPLIRGPLQDMCKLFEEHLHSAGVLRECLAMKRPPFIYTLYAMRDIEQALQMPDLHFPPLTGGNIRNNIIDF